MAAILTLSGQAGSYRGYQRAVLADLGHTLTTYPYGTRARVLGRVSGVAGVGWMETGHKRASPSRLSVVEDRAHKRYVAWYILSVLLFYALSFLFSVFGLKVLTMVLPTVRVTAGTVRLMYKPCAVGAGVGSSAEVSE